MNQQTKLKDLETSVPENVKEGGLVVSKVTLSSLSFTLGPPTPVKKIVSFCHATHIKKKLISL
jgi:hypothetical protein